MQIQKFTKPSKETGAGKEVMSRVYFVFTIIFLFVLAVIGRILYIQFGQGPELKKLAREQEYRFMDIEPIRGNIYSSDGYLLATSIPIYEIRMDAACEWLPDSIFNKNVAGLAKGLSQIFGDKSPYEYQQMIVKARADTNHYLKIQRNVSYDQLKLLQKLPIFDRGRYKGGMIAERETRREYPYDILARRTIGYVKIPKANKNEKQPDSILVGLEGYYNDLLAGKNGKELRQRIANGVWRPVNNDANIMPENGKDIITTIDTYLQDVAETSLLKHLEMHKATNGTVVLMEVSTGEVRAIANLQLDTSDGRYKESINIAVGGAYEPGSVFKLPSIMAAMEDGVIARTHQVYVGKGVTVYHGRTMKDAHQIGDDGWLTPLEIFEHSSNVGVSRIIYDNYQSRPYDFVHRLQQFHLYSKLGIEIPGETPPILNHPDSSSWSKVSLPWMSIGYELTVTPLQLLTFYNAVANDGVMVKPRFVKEIRESGLPVKTFGPEVIDDAICSKETATMARHFLEAVVEDGTGTNIRDSVYRIAGKTGTAQIAENGVYIKKYNASFIGYFPADAPKYSCVVVIHKPNAGQYYATRVAAPVFKEIADVVYSRELDIHSDASRYYVKNLQKVPEKKQDTLFVKFGIDPDSTNVYQAAVVMDTLNENPDLVPNVVGLKAREAVLLLERLGLKPEVEGRGIVVSQSKVAGSPLIKGDQIKLMLEI